MRLLWLVLPKHNQPLPCLRMIPDAEGPWASNRHTTDRTNKPTKGACQYAMSACLQCSPLSRAGSVVLPSVWWCMVCCAVDVFPPSPWFFVAGGGGCMLSTSGVLSWLLLWLMMSKAVLTHTNLSWLQLDTKALELSQWPSKGLSRWCLWGPREREGHCESSHLVYQGRGLQSYSMGLHTSMWQIFDK